MVGVKWRVFSKEQLIRPKFNLPLIFLVTLKEWLVLRDKLNYSQTNVGAKVQPHQALLVIVFPNQMESTYDLFRIMVFVLATSRTQVNSKSLLFR